MVATGPDARPAGLWPTETYFERDKELFFNGEAVQIIHQPAAHTDGDSIVFFRRSDVIATGDIFTTTMYPFIDAPRGGSVNGIIDALNRIIDLAIPDHKVQEGGTMIIPGHGRLCDEQDVIEYRDMVTIVRDRIQYMIKKGMTLDQVKAARPTLDFDPRYGADTGFWTTAMFVETIYRESQQEQVAPVRPDERQTRSLRRHGVGRVRPQWREGVRRLRSLERYMKNKPWR